jgi:cytochrome P450
MTTASASTLPLPPGHSGLPVIGETISFLKDPNFASKRHKQSDVLERVRAEQKQFPHDEPLTLENLKQMEYLEQVLREVLRVIPPVGGAFRQVIQTCEINGYRIPEGWTIVYQINQTHQDSAFYSGS